VASVTGLSERGETVPALYSVGHSYDGSPGPRTYWQAVRRTGASADSGSEVHLRLIDRAGTPAYEGARRLGVRLRCCHGNRPARRPVADWKLIDGELTARAASPVHPPVRPRAGDLGFRGAAHQIAARDALNRLGTITAAEGAAALRALLRHRGHLDWEATPDLAAQAFRLREPLERLIEGIVSVAACRDPHPQAAVGPRFGRLVTVGLSEAAPAGRGILQHLLARLFRDRDGFPVLSRVEIATVPVAAAHTQSAREPSCATNLVEAEVGS
jgi:hypothetical protein